MYTQKDTFVTFVYKIWLFCAVTDKNAKCLHWKHWKEEIFKLSVVFREIPLFEAQNGQVFNTTTFWTVCFYQKDWNANQDQNEESRNAIEKDW